MDVHLKIVIKAVLYVLYAFPNCDIIWNEDFLKIEKEKRNRQFWQLSKFIVLHGK